MIYLSFRKDTIFQYGYLLWLFFSFLSPEDVHKSIVDNVAAGMWCHSVFPFRDLQGEMSLVCCVGWGKLKLHKNASAAKISFLMSEKSLSGDLLNRDV